MMHININTPFWKPALSKLIFLFILTVTMLGISGCITYQFRMGKDTKPHNIEATLTLYESTQEDVKRIFGVPEGVGVYVSPITGIKSVLWTYYFAEGDLNKMNDTYLYVYFDGDIYEGYLWFENSLENPRPVTN